MKKTDKLVWYDLLKRPSSVVTFGASTSSDSSSDGAGSSSGSSSSSASSSSSSANAQAKPEGSDEVKGGQKWLFGALLGLLDDPSTATSSTALGKSMVYECCLFPLPSLPLFSLSSVPLSSPLLPPPFPSYSILTHNYFFK
jgi:hypothetical protein